MVAYSMCVKYSTAFFRFCLHCHSRPSEFFNEFNSLTSCSRSMGVRFVGKIYGERKEQKRNISQKKQLKKLFKRGRQQTSVMVEAAA